MDETFRKEFGISRNDEPKKLCNEKRRPPPPAYHQIHPSISMGYADGLCGDNNNGVHHQRVRSMHESPASFLQQTVSFTIVSYLFCRVLLFFFEI